MNESNKHFTIPQNIGLIKAYLSAFLGLPLVGILYSLSFVFHCLSLLSRGLKRLIPFSDRWTLRGKLSLPRFPSPSRIRQFFASREPMHFFSQKGYPALVAFFSKLKQEHLYLWQKGAIRRHIPQGKKNLGKGQPPMVEASQTCLLPDKEPETPKAQDCFEKGAGIHI